MFYNLYVELLPNLLETKEISFIRRRKEVQNAYTFFFDKGDIKYQAGQHFVYTLKHPSPDDRGISRIFSASSAPSEHFISFTTRFFGKDSSTFKKALMELQKGEKISIWGPSPVSDIYKITDYSLPHVFIAGGIGITPFRSVLVESVSTDKNLIGALYYCNRDKDLIFGDEIQKRIGELVDFDFISVIEPKKLTKTDLKKCYSKFGKDTIFTISGTPGFVEFVSNLLINEIGVDSYKVKSYRYRGLFGGASYK